VTAQTAFFSAPEASRVASWKIWSWLGKGAAAITVRLAVAATMIVVGGVIAPLLAAEAMVRYGGLSG
jgi:hypothetical protein